MRAGDLRKRITFQMRVTTKDALGGQLGNWVDFATVWAEIRPLNSYELFRAQAIQSEISHEITIRYVPGITASMRAVYNGRIFNLSPPMNTNERNIELVIPATEGLNDG